MEGFVPSLDSRAHVLNGMRLAIGADAILTRLLLLADPCATSEIPREAVAC